MRLRPRENAIIKEIWKRRGQVLTVQQLTLLQENITKQKSTKPTFCSHTGNSGSDCVIGIDDLQLLNRRQEIIALSFVVLSAFSA